MNDELARLKEAWESWRDADDDAEHELFNRRNEAANAGVYIAALKARIEAMRVVLSEYKTRLTEIAGPEYTFVWGETIEGERDEYRELFEHAKWQAQTALKNADALADDTKGET